MTIRRLASNLLTSAATVGAQGAAQLMRDASAVLSTLTAKDGEFKIIAYYEQVTAGESRDSKLLDRKLVFPDSYTNAIRQREPGPGPGPGTSIFRDGLVTHKEAMSALAASVLENSQLRAKLESLSCTARHDAGSGPSNKKQKVKGVKNGR